MEKSLLMNEARTMIEQVKGTSLSINERKDKAIILAAFMLDQARQIQTAKEKKHQQQLAGMMNDPIGKTFTTIMTDQCFRSHRPRRVADQLTYVIHKYGVPSYLPLDRKIALHAFARMGKLLAPVLVPLTVQLLRKETETVILPGEEKPLIKHMEKRRQEHVRINLNHLGEAILGEQEAQHRLEIYLNDLAQPHVEYISVKISTIYSQINLLAWNETLEVLASRLRQLYRAAMQHTYLRSDGTKVSKFVNLDMEEYRDLHLTVALFRKVLDEPEFYQHEAGIVLQSYLPDSYLIQQELTAWAMQRVAQGGAPIKIRIVKGANLAMEKVEAALKLWPQAPYTTKADVDANFKRMVNYGCQKEHAHAAHLGIGSHNLFDIAYTLLLRAENGVEKEVIFEMLEGMADHLRRVVQQLSGDMLLYCPAATKVEFQNAVAYLVRRLDENTAPENFLRQAFDLRPGTPQWEKQAELFANACFACQDVYYHPRRNQDRWTETFAVKECCKFDNEPDTDWSLLQNRQWVDKILHDWKGKKIEDIPLVIGGEQILMSDSYGIGEDPSHPGKELYRYVRATQEQINQALTVAKQVEAEWGNTSAKERARLLGQVAANLRRHRGRLIGAMIADAGKTVQEADVEISEAIDFAEYYRCMLEEWSTLKDIKWQSKGTVLVAPPWNFPCSIPAGGILASLAAGNAVLFKPATESILVGWILVQIFWEAGMSPKVLQFIMCEDDPVGSLLIKDPRVNAIVLTGATATAKLFLRLRPGLDLVAETGGKNTMIVTGMSDRDLAVKDLIHSAFGHAGQKCSACSLAILEAEVYDDPQFLKQLKDAALSLRVGSAWDPQTKVNPLIRQANPTLLKGLTQLEKGEEWLIEPKQDPQNPQLWSPGIKLGVKPSSFTFQNELFGPVLALVRADDVEHAFQLMNQTAYGLTAGIHSLDEREQTEWLKRIEAGNCYMNRTITGAIVQRQPFGGCKDSGFGRGAKAGGPNYLVQLMKAEQIALPQEQEENREVKELTQVLETLLDQNAKELWKASVGNYQFYWHHYFSQDHDPSCVLGQDNIQRYKPHSQLVFRVQTPDQLMDACRVVAAALTCHAPLEVSDETGLLETILKKSHLLKRISYRKEDEEAFIKRLETGQIKRVRLISEPSDRLRLILAYTACHLNTGAVLANGRLELLHHLREVSISCDYHRYGNLGEREGEERHSLPSSQEMTMNTICECYG